MLIERKGKVRQAGGGEMDLLRNLSYPVRVNRRRQRQRRVETAQQRQLVRRLSLIKLKFKSFDQRIHESGPQIACLAAGDDLAVHQNPLRHGIQWLAAQMADALILDNRQRRPAWRR